MLGVWIDPVTAQLMITLLGIAFLSRHCGNGEFAPAAGEPPGAG
jgi:hypothetical protein